MSQDADYVFDITRELGTYFSSDDYILRLTCLNFREGFQIENKVYPFRQAVTTTSACMKAYRTIYTRTQ